MAGSRNRVEPHDFYCINCGKKGIPIWRERGDRRVRNHRKLLYCTNCRMTINHIEIYTEEDAEQFREDFASGKYATEAAECIAYINNKVKRQEEPV